MVVDSWSTRIIASGVSRYIFSVQVSWVLLHFHPYDAFEDFINLITLKNVASFISTVSLCYYIYLGKEMNIGGEEIDLSLIHI